MKRFLALLLGISMLSSHCVIPVYAAEEPLETAYVEETDQTEETLIMDEVIEETEDVFFSESELGTEVEAEITIQPLEPFSSVYINPLYADVISASDFTVSTDAYAVSLLEEPEYLKSQSDFIAAVRSAMEGRKNRFTIYYETTKMFEKEELDQIILMALAETGVSTQGDYLRLHFGGYGISVSGYTDGIKYYLSVAFECLYYTTYEQEQMVTSAVNNLIQSFGFNSSTSEYEKIKTIYDWMCLNISYDYDNLNDDSYLLMYTTYAALINKTSVCQGYSSLFYRLCREAGLSVRCITGIGNGGRHAWNIVKIGNLYYNIDATWDSIYTQGGFPEYVCFLKCDANFFDHSRDAEYSTDEYYAAYPMSSKDYDTNIVVPSIKDEHIFLEYTSCKFTGKSLTPKVNVTVNGKVLACNEDYTVEYGNNYNVGEAYVIVKGIGNYTGQVQKNFTITKASISDTLAVLNQKNYTYTGKSIKPEPVVSMGNYTLIKGTDYTLTYSNNVNAGTAAIKIVGMGNFNSDSINVSFKILKADQTLSASIENSVIRIDESTMIYATGKGNVSYKSLNTNIATVDSNGLVKGIKEGETVIEVTADGGNNYNSVTKTIAIRVISKLNTYTVIYDTNGGTNQPANQTKVEGEMLELTSVVPKKTYKITYDSNDGKVSSGSKTLNLTFTGWNTKADGTGTAYASGSDYTEDKELVLYAQYETVKAGTLATPTRDGYTFEGWYTAKSGGTKVTSGTEIKSNIKIYARWKQTYTGVEAFVARLYNVCLNRNPDAAGLADWTKRLTTKDVDGVTAAYGFIFSAEFINKNLCNEDYVKQLYRAFLGREADAGGLKDWVGQLESGVTRESVFNGFALSVEFGNLCKSYGISQGSGIAIPQHGTQPNGACAICGKEDGVTAFVKRLYRVCLNREADDGGLSDWTGKLRTHTATGRSVAYGFIFSQEFINKKYNNADYVEHLYLAFMGRGSDAGGKADWIKRMEKDGWTREQVFDGFVGSQEFTKICNSYGITRD